MTFSVKRIKKDDVNLTNCILFVMLPLDLIPFLAHKLTIKERVTLSITCKYMYYLIWENCKRTRTQIWKDVIGPSDIYDKRRLIQVVKHAFGAERIIRYPTRDRFHGGRNWVPLNTAKCREFGFKHGQRVDTPRGKGVIIGVIDRDLWMHLDADDGASFWAHTYTPEDFAKRDIFPCETEHDFKGPKMPPNWVGFTIKLHQ